MTGSLALRVLLLAATTIAVAVAAGAARAAEPWIAVVVAGDAPPDALDANDLSLVFRRRKDHWEDGTRIVPVNLPADTDLRRRFSRAILHQSPEAMEDYWNEQYFQGVLPPHVVESESAMRRFVAETAGSIGYVEACAAPPEFRILLLVDPALHVQPASALPACTPR